MMNSMTKPLQYTLAILLVNLITACGGGGGNPEPTAPTTLSITPANGSTLMGDTPIVVQFDQSMTPDAPALTGTLAAEGDGGSWSTTVLENDTFTLKPTMTWRHGASRTIGLDPKSINNLNLTQPTSLTYNVNNIIHLISVHNDGTQGNDDSRDYSIGMSSDNRYVAFSSAASNLVDNDTNGRADIFLRDRQIGTTSRISVATGGIEANGASIEVAMSENGRYVAFESSATNLAEVDLNTAPDVFVHDRQTGETVCISLNSDGNATANNGSYKPSMSAGGRYVAFYSNATDLVPVEDDPNGIINDVFVHDRNTGTTTRISKSHNGAIEDGHSSIPVISADGRFVVYESQASNLVDEADNGVQDIFITELATGNTTRISKSYNDSTETGGSYETTISADGRYVAFTSGSNNIVADDTNSVNDIFVYDRQDDVMTRASVSSEGTEANGNNIYPTISADGRYVAFGSNATNLLDTEASTFSDIYMRDLQAGTTHRLSVASDGAEANSNSYKSALSADGRYVAFQSAAGNLVESDNNGNEDIFVVPTPY